MVEPNQFGERCPICLGETIAVVQRTLAQEEDPTLQRTQPGPRMEAVIDNVRSAWNVGSIFRSAEGFGVCHLYLGGITPTPENEQVRKTALGAENIVPWSAHRNAVALIDQLKAEGRAIWALERTAGSRPLDVVREERPRLDNVVMVVGNELAGIDPGILERADQIVHVEMRGRKRSFNVAVAFAVAAHVLSRP